MIEGDFYAWANEQAALLRAGRLSEADIENIAEEIESMGKTEKRELVSRLSILLLDLLKWQYQPMLRGPSWQVTVRVQRHALVVHMADNPSLKSVLALSISQAYESAVIMAEGETGLPGSTFPGACPWSFETLLDTGFWPEPQP